MLRRWDVRGGLVRGALTILAVREWMGDASQLNADMGLDWVTGWTFVPVQATVAQVSQSYLAYLLVIENKIYKCLLCPP